MVEESDFADAECGFKLAGGLDVGIAGERDGRGMVMDNNDSGSLLLEGLPGYGPAVQSCGIQTSAADFLFGYQIVGPIEVENPAFFMVEALQERKHETKDSPGRTYGCS